MTDESMLGDDLRGRWPQWTTVGGFADYVRDVVADALEDSPRRPGWVPCTTLWYVESDEYLGRLAIRHRLTPHLLELGGHIGYDVRRSARRQGHATAMLRAALPVAAELGIDAALLTCDADNVASRRLIEYNGECSRISAASSCGSGSRPPDPSHCSGNGDCSHHGESTTRTSVTHFTHQNPRRPGATSRTGAPCPGDSAEPPTRVASSRW